MIKRLKPGPDEIVLGQWYWEFSIETRNYRYHDVFMRTLRFGVFKVHTWPTPGARMVRGDNYRGFWLSLHYWLPWAWGN